MFVRVISPCGIDKLSCSLIVERPRGPLSSLLVVQSVLRLRYCSAHAAVLNFVLLTGNDCITMNNGTWDSSGRALWQSGCCITVSQRRGTRREQQTVNATRAFNLSLSLSLGFYSPSPLSLSVSRSFILVLVLAQRRYSK